MKDDYKADFKVDLLSKIDLYGYKISFIHKIANKFTWGQVWLEKEVQKMKKAYLIKKIHRKI